MDITGGTGPVKKYKAPVIPLGNVTRLNLPPDRILEAAKGRLENVVLMGQEADGSYYFASSAADGGVVLWLMEKLRLKLMGFE